MNTHFGRYRVLQKLGQGAMSAVFLARDPVLSRLVAIKVLHQDLLIQKSVMDRFFKEAKIAARIGSPNIVEVFDFGIEGRSPFLVLEFINGQTLQDFMDQLQGEPLDPVVAASLVCQAAGGLAAAAEAGVVHRDLKPANVMISDKGFAKVTDFGISHLAEHTITRTGQVLGSPRFMSPEQVKGAKPITPQSDLFSMGSVLYYCLTGKLPFQSDSVPELYRQITNEPHVPLQEYCPDLDPGICRLVDTLLNKEPERRGDGPSWLQSQLRKYLMMNQVLDPVEKVAAFIRDISSQGFRTTCHLDHSELKRLQGSFDLGKKPGRMKKPRLVAAGLVILVSIACLSGYWFLGPSPAPVDSPSASGPVADEISNLNPGQKAADAMHVVEVIEPDSIAVVQEPISEAPTSLPATNPEAAESITNESSESILSIYSAPPFAEVSIDGIEMGRTPIEKRSIRAGKYRLELRSKIGTTLDTIITLPPGDQVHKFTLAKNPEDTHD